MADPVSSVEHPSRNSTSSPSHMPGNGLSSHRSSFAENLRHSPRAQRHPSLSQAAVQELLHQQPAKTGDPRFVGRDWRQVHVGELVHTSDVKWVELDSGVEEASKVGTPSFNMEHGRDNRHLILNLIN